MCSVLQGNMAAYENLGRIGEGTYGLVLKCRHKMTGELVAIKRFKEGDDDEQVKKTAMREVKILRSLEHDNIVRLLEVGRLQRKLFLVFEYVEGTILQELERHPKGLGDLRTRRLMWQLASAVGYLHSRKVVHRDIKPENMLLSSSGMLKLCDFGFARPFPSRAARGDMSDYVATRWYRAPELLVGSRDYGSAVDVWAIGCMVVEMQTGQPLFPGASDIDQLWLILKSMPHEHAAWMQQNPLFRHMRMPQAHERESLESRLPMLKPDALDLVKACLHPDPMRRKTCRELLQMPYFHGAKSWFPVNFFPLEARANLARTACVDRERSKSRRQKRKQAGAVPLGRNMTPCRDPRSQENSSSTLTYQSSDAVSCAMQTDSCAESTRTPLASQQSLISDASNGDSQISGLVKCSISLPQGAIQDAEDYHMGIVPPQQPGNLAPNEQSTPEDMQLGPRRSQRLQASQCFGAQPDWDSHRIPGSLAAARVGSQFMSPDPTARNGRRDRRLPMLPGGRAPQYGSPSRRVTQNHGNTHGGSPARVMADRSPLRVHRPDRNMGMSPSKRQLQQSPLKGTWQDDPPKLRSQGRGRGHGLARVSPGVNDAMHQDWPRQEGKASFPMAQEPAQPNGIPAYYGGHQTKPQHAAGLAPGAFPHNLMELSTPPMHWAQKTGGDAREVNGWGQHHRGGMTQHAPHNIVRALGHEGGRQSPMRWQRDVQHPSNGWPEVEMAASFRSPLRAHAPVFVPSALQALQGTRAEIHQAPASDAN